jgi:hypothetical protein
MHEEIPKNFIEKAKKTSLSKERKEAIRHAIVKHSQETYINTPYFTPSPFFSSFAKGFSFALIVLVVGGSTITYASNNTLPGDLLYTVKVNFAEPLERSLRFSQEAKMETKTKHIERRLTEAQILIKKDTHTTNQHEELRQRIERQIKEINSNIDILETNGQANAILEVTSRLDSVLKAHKNILNQNLNETKTALKTIEGTDTEIIKIEIEEEVSTKLQTKPQDSLLTTLTNVISQIEERETALIKHLQNTAQEEKTNSVTQQRMQRAQAKISELKKEIEIERITLERSNTSNQVEINTFLQESSEEIQKNLRNNINELILVEAEIVLHNAQELFANNQHKEALARAQEAIKLTESISTNKKIEELILLLQENNISLPEEITEIKDEEKDIDFESQAIEAIKNLEEKLQENTN